MKTDEELRNKMFEFMVELMLLHGGDGDVVYKGSHWKINADAFQIWSDIHYPNYFTRFDWEKSNRISFSNDQEGIHFGDIDYPKGGYDIISTELI